MMNPIQFISMMKNASNPISFMQNTVGSTPQFQRVMKMVEGKSPEEMQQVARNICQQQGIDFSQMIGRMKSLGINVPDSSQNQESK